MMDQRYKAILFDMDGVVVNSMPFHYRSWEQIFEALGIQVDKMEIYKWHSIRKKSRDILYRPHHVTPGGISSGSRYGV